MAVGQVLLALEDFELVFESAGAGVAEQVVAVDVVLDVGGEDRQHGCHHDVGDEQQGSDEQGMRERLHGVVIGERGGAGRG